MVENDPPDELVSINEADQHVTTTQIEAIELEEIAIGAGETYLKRIEMFFPKDEEEEVNKNIKEKEKEKEKVKEKKKKKSGKKTKEIKNTKNSKDSTDATDAMVIVLKKTPRKKKKGPKELLLESTASSIESIRIRLQKWSTQLNYLISLRAIDIEKRKEIKLHIESGTCIA